MKKNIKTYILIIIEVIIVIVLYIFLKDREKIILHLSILSVILAIVDFFFVKFKKAFNYSLLRGSKKDILTDLIKIIWHYQEQSDDHKSWSLKEGKIIKNEENNLKDPGLGVAILTTDFAFKYFNKYSLPKFNDCIEWVVNKYNIDIENPNLKHIDSLTQNEIDNIRHTRALAIILVRTNRIDYVKQINLYLENIKLEIDKNIMSATPGKPNKELFTMLYSWEFVFLCKKLQIELIYNYEELDEMETKIYDWIISDKKGYSLWTGGVLIDEPILDKIWASSWILHRILRNKPEKIKDQSILNAVKDLLKHDLKNDIEKVLKREKLPQKYLINARKYSALSFVDEDLIDEKLIVTNLNNSQKNWKKLNSTVLNKKRDIDLATAVFIIDSLFSKNEIEKVNIIELKN